MRRACAVAAGLALCTALSAAALHPLAAGATPAAADSQSTGCAHTALLVLSHVTHQVATNHTRPAVHPGWSILPLTDGVLNPADATAGAKEPDAALPRAAPASVTVNYSGFPSAARAAFQFAVDEWKSNITSPAPIVIEADFTQLPTDVLGGAIPSSLAHTATSPWYPIALADALAGTRLDPSEPDVVAEFNSTQIPWYFGTDGNTPPGMIDFATVVLHELGHGFGFFGTLAYSNGVGTFALGPATGPTIFDLFITDSDQHSLAFDFNDPSTELGSELTSGNLFFTGPATGAATGGAGLRLYSPPTWQQGSSIYHADFSATGAALMVPALATGVAIHAPGPIVDAVFNDIGWPTATVGIPSAPRNVSAKAGATTATIAWTAPASNGGATVTAYHVSLTDPAGTVTTADATASRVTVRKLRNGAQYSVRVTASNAVGTGAQSPVLEVTPRTSATTTTVHHNPTTTTTTPHCATTSTTAPKGKSGSTTSTTQVSVAGVTTPISATPTAAPSAPAPVDNGVAATQTNTTPLPRTGAGSTGPIVLVACVIAAVALAARRTLFRRPASSAGRS